MYVGGGVYTLFVSFFGLAAVAQKSPALLVIYSFLLFVSFLILCAGVFLTVSVSIMVEKDVENGPFLDTIANYGHESAATREIDLIQSQ